MSYIIKCNDPFVSVKLTEKGREKLSRGELTFGYWSVGDSEVNYDELIPNSNTTPQILNESMILRPKDKQPNQKYYVYDGNNILTPLNSSNLSVVQIVANNEATERGFFSGGTSGYTTLTTARYIQSSGLTTANHFTGGTTVNVGSLSGYSTGDFILFKFTNDDISPSVTPGTNSVPIPSLWYKIEDQLSGTTSLQVDRNLPNLSGDSSDVEYYIYPSGQVWDSFGQGSTSAYWDNGTLTFNSSCNISVQDVPIWNMNIPFAENIIGSSSATTLFENYQYYGSYDYLGSMYPYLGYNLNTMSDDNTDICGGVSSLDKGQKEIAIIHYTNRTISNFYGEFFYIDNSNNKTVKIHLPTLMYHRRQSPGSGLGSTMGMSFIASGDVKTVESSNIEYVDLIEDPHLIQSGSTPAVVGRVYPQLKIITIHDEEIVAAMSYKSNRNWTLPELEANLVQPSAGANSGILPPTKTIYVTYGLSNENNPGLQTPLPNQKYIKLTNETSSTQDVEFRLKDIGLLPYMRKIEDSSYDGLGFYADKFKIYYQIVDNVNDRPLSDKWKEVDFTSTNITGNIGETISPILLENQSPVTNGFILNSGTTSGATYYNINPILNLPLRNNSEGLQFGDERFFYGNLEAFIGATIYKTIFDIRINTANFTHTTNPTRSQDPTTNPPNIRVSEIGIYDNDKNLVVIGKLMSPIELVGGNTILIELGLDF